MSLRDPFSPLDNPWHEAIAQVLAKQLREHEDQYHAHGLPYPSLAMTEAATEKWQRVQERSTKRTAWLWSFVLGWAALLALLIVYAITRSNAALGACIFAVVLMLCVVTWHPGYKAYDKKAPKQ